MKKNNDGKSPLHNEKKTRKESAPPSNFIRNIVAEDLKTGKWGGRVVTRFPPEPNGYLHIGHAKSICLNFGIAAENRGGICHLRFDDTNPGKEETEYTESIMSDVRWLGFDWGEHLYYASDYFEKLYEYAIKLIKKGKAYVCHLSSEEMRSHRGTLTEPGKESPYRGRSVEENLSLFERMRNGEFEDGACVLRAKIDMASPNLNMRDPIIYRIRHLPHHRTENRWCIYPMYDFTHCLSDSIEKITHSLCTLEFEDHRLLYDWFLDELETPYHPQQIEFARLNLTYTIMSKRKLLQLVEENVVDGWGDPRMPTIAGLKNRGYTPKSIKNFCEKIGVGKQESWIDMTLLENSIREDLNVNAPRAMCVINPLKIRIENYPENHVEEVEARNHPDNPKMGTRKLPFSKVIYIERDDFLENPPKKYFRLSPGREVRLKYAYFIKCKEVKKDADGNILEVICTYDPETKGGSAPDGRKVKGTIHWVSATHSKYAQIRLYDRLFTVANPGAAKDDRDFKSYLNPDSLKILTSCRLESNLSKVKSGVRFQFERLGYFYAAGNDSQNNIPVFNRIVSLRDTWAKIEKSEKKHPET